LKIHIEPCELRDVVGASLQPLKDEIEKRNIVIHIPEDIPEIPMDFVLMMRVFINLVDNAVKYSPAETAIEITATPLKENIKIDIKDEGMGIPKEDLVKVFDKFYRAFKPRQITGTGLGLSICKGIVEVHGGQIFAQNNADRGVTVSIVLPLSSRQWRG
jgi:two-component system sensor histidine kinase KdpD